MKKILGVSLTELMMTISIVSVIGAGAFVGIQQLDEAQNQVQSRAAQMANAQLLLPLIEMEQARHGQQVLDPDPICLIDHDGSEWKHSCVEGDEVPSPAKGFLTCRILENGKAQRTAMYFSSAVEPGSDPEIYAYRLFRQAFESDDCDLSRPDLQTDGFYNDTANFDLSKHDTLTGVASRFVLSDEVTSFEVNYSADGLTVENSMTFVANKSLVTDGTSTRLEENQLEFETSVTPSLIEDQRPIFSFGTQSINIASGSDAKVYVFSSRPVFTSTTVLWALGNSSGTAIIKAGQTRSSSPIPISNASASNSLILLPSEDYLTDEFAELVIQEKENFKPDVRARLSANRLIYGGPAETIEVFLTGQASGATKIELEIDKASCDSEDDPVVLKYSSSDTCPITVEISDGATTPSSEIRIKAAASGTDKFITATFQAASGSNYYGLGGTPELSFELASDLPEISFLSSQSKSIRAASGSKKHRVILLSDQALPRDIAVNLSVASGATAACSYDYQIPDQTDCDSSYETTFPAGRFEHEFEIDIKPDAANDDKESFKLAIDEGSYAVDSDNDEHTVELLQYSVVSFASASISNVDESQSTLSIPLTLSPKAENEVKLYFSSAAADATSNQFNDWTFASSSNPLIASGSSATLTLKLKDDEVPEGIEKIAITFDEDKLIGEVIAASGSQSILETSDDAASDFCYPAGDLTIGDSGDEHFHDTIGDDDVSGADIKGGSIQITDGFQTSDRLTVTGEPDDDTSDNKNLVTHESYSVEVGDVEYDFTVTYTITSGVMVWELESGTIDAKDLVSVFNKYVLLTVDDFSDTNTRKVVFTLGSAQAWDRHEDGTTHYYQFVTDNGEGDGIDWDDAFDDSRASKNEYFGVRGYLATVTSRSENDFLADKFKIDGGPISGWLGGSNKKYRPDGVDSNAPWPEGLGHTDDIRNGKRWGWTDGPEFEELFWSGLAGCSDPIVEATGNIEDIFPYDVQKSGRRDEEDLDDNHCQFDYSDDNITQWLPKSSTWLSNNYDYLECVDQTSELNGNAHDPGKSPHQMKYGYNYDNEIVDGRVKPSQNKYRFSNFGCGRANNKFHQPDWSGDKEYYLQLTGLAVGGKMWNDLKNDPDSQSTDYKKIYEIKGYYMEWGGTASPFSFTGKKLSQTNTVTPYKCKVAH